MDNLAKHKLVLVMSEKTAYLAQSEERILKHLRGKYPTNYSIQKIPSHAHVTYEMGEELMENAAYNHITAVCNFL